MLPPERWALTPPFHPYRAASPSAIRLRGLLSGRLEVFLQMATEAHCTGGLFSVALSVAENLASLARNAPGAGCTCSRPDKVSAPWRYQARCPYGLSRAAPRTFIRNSKREDHGVRTFLPAGFLTKAGPAITRPIRQRQVYHQLPNGVLRYSKTDSGFLPLAALNLK